MGPDMAPSGGRRKTAIALRSEDKQTSSERAKNGAIDPICDIGWLGRIIGVPSSTLIEIDQISPVDELQRAIGSLDMSVACIRAYSVSGNRGGVAIAGPTVNRSRANSRKSMQHWCDSIDKL